MNVRAAVSVVLLITIVSAGIFLSLYINDFCDRLIVMTESAAEHHDLSAFNAARKEWLKKNSLLSALVPHHHVDGISASFDRAMSFMSDGDDKEFFAETVSVINQLKVIKGYDIPSLRSIF